MDKNGFLVVFPSEKFLNGPSSCTFGEITRHYYCVTITDLYWRCLRKTTKQETTVQTPSYCYWDQKSCLSGKNWQNCVNIVNILTLVTYVTLWK
jgi:hypothetical protein